MKPAALTFATAFMFAGCISDGVANQDQEASKSGATLQASKTVDICTVGDGDWRYSGEVSVWNEGATDAAGLHIFDSIQNKTGAGQFHNTYTALDSDEPGIPAFTPEELAYTFGYFVDAPPLLGDIRNSAVVTIINHAGGQVSGPNPKATWLGGSLPPPCVTSVTGCTLTLGYWSQSFHAWPAAYDRNALFFNSGLTWDAQENSPGGGNGYNILAVQYIAAVLNGANGASVPAGVQDILNQATAWFGSVADAATACPSPSSCGLQKTWGAILDDYNNGVYPGGPGHCGG